MNTPRQSSTKHLNAVFSALGIADKREWLEAPPDKLGRLVKSVVDRAHQYTRRELEDARGPDYFVKPENWELEPKFKGIGKVGARPFTFPAKGKII